MTAGPIEYELGVPIPGNILPQSKWAKTAIKRLPEAGPLDWAAIFGRDAPIVVDLGCGNGRYTLMSALARPEFDHFAIDLLPMVIRYATRRANQRGLHNVRFAVKDAQTFMRQYVASASVAEIHLYHPQPYHDPRKAHLCALAPRLLADIHEALVPGGLFVVQTDNPDYWDYMTRVLPAFFQFREHPGVWSDAPEGRNPARDHGPTARPADLPGLGDSPRRLEPRRRGVTCRVAPPAEVPQPRAMVRAGSVGARDAKGLKGGTGKLDVKDVLGEIPPPQGEWSGVVGELLGRRRCGFRRGFNAGSLGRADVVERLRAPGCDVSAYLRDQATPLIVRGSGEAGVPLLLVFNLCEQPRSNGVLILGGKLLGLRDRTLKKFCHATSDRLSCRRPPRLSFSNDLLR